MAIEVVCPGCKKRFSVSEKFAGKKGPCPKCKAEITIPEKSAEVVVHAPESFGPKDAQGRAVLKPIARSEARLSKVAIAGIALSCVAVLAVAVVLRGAEVVPVAILAVGAILLGPPLAAAGYSFLRDSELEPFRGTSLLIRSTICGLVYAALWGAYVSVPAYVLQIQSVSELEVFQLLFIVPPLVIVGSLAAVICYELEFTSGMLHYALYLLVTLALCFVMDVRVF